MSTEEIKRFAADLKSDAASQETPADQAVADGAGKDLADADLDGVAGGQRVIVIGDVTNALFGPH